MRALRSFLQRYEEKKQGVVFFELGVPRRGDKESLRIGRRELEPRRGEVQPCQHMNGICGDTAVL